MRAALHDNSNLARTTVVWKTKNGSSRERLLLIRSCARLGRAEVVLALLAHSLDSKLLCEELFLDALPGDKSSVSLISYRAHQLYVLLHVLVLVNV